MTAASRTQASLRAAQAEYDDAQLAYERLGYREISGSAFDLALSRLTEARRRLHELRLGTYDDSRPDGRGADEADQ